MSDRILSQHECRAVVLTCIDFRFAGGRSARAIEQAYGLGENEYDIVAVPGGAQNLTKHKLALHYAESTQHALGVAIGLHHVSSIIVLSHQNCGALKAVGKIFGEEDVKAEIEFHQSLLTEARASVKTKWPQLVVEAGYIFVDEGNQSIVIEKL